MKLQIKDNFDYINLRIYMEKKIHTYIFFSEYYKNFINRKRIERSKLQTNHINLYFGKPQEFSCRLVPIGAGRTSHEL